MQQWGERKVCLLSGGWAFCLVQPGAMKGIRLYLYARQAPNARDGKELFRSMTNVSRENGSKTAVTRVKLEVRRSELWEWADPAEVSVAAGRKERRWWSAIVWSVYSIARISGGGSALQGSSRTSYATGKKKIKKKIRVCALCFVSNQCSKSWVSPGSTAGRAALPGRHTDAWKGAGWQCRQPTLPFGRAHITVQMQQGEIIAK